MGFESVDSGHGTAVEGSRRGVTDLGRAIRETIERLEELRRALATAASSGSGVDAGRPEPSRRVPLDGASAVLEEAMAIQEDLLERHEALQASQDARDVERRFHEELVELAPDPCMVTDASGVVTEANVAALALLGVPPELVKGRPLADFVDARSRRELRRHVAQLLQDHDAPAPVVFQLDLRPKGRAPIPVEMTIARLRSLPDQAQWLSFLARDLRPRRELESRLQVSEERIRDLVENMREVFWASTPGHRILYASPSYEEVWGRPVASLYGSRGAWHAAILPEDRPKVLAALRAGNGYDLRYRIVRGDGATRWIRDRAFPVRDAAGVVKRLVGSAEDVTDQVHDQDALRESEARYRSIVETLNDAHVETDAEGRITGWNPQAEVIFGHTFSEVAGRSVAEVIVPPRHREEHRRGLERLRSGLAGSPVNTRMETQALHRDGHEIPVEISLWPVSSDGRVRFHALVRDISHRVTARDLLRAEKERAQKLLDVAGVVVLLVGPGGRIDLANRFACDLLGYEESELRGRSLAELCDGTDEIAAVVRRLARSRSGTDREQVRGRLLSKNGKSILLDWLCVSFAEDRDAVLCSGVDVTERERVAQVLVEKSSLEKLGEMAAVVAHQVRNPLASIIACAQSLEVQLADRGPERPLVALILERARFLGTTVDHILEYARQREPVLEPVALMPLLRDTIALAEHHPDIGSRNVVLEGEDLVIAGDAPQLKELFTNLIMNAAQASQPAAKVWVRAAREQGTARERVVRIDVEDSGCGIAPEIRERVFQPFFSTKHRGTGLGLAIVQGIVRGLHGTVEILDRESGGTIMRVRLPMGTPGAKAT